MASLRLLLFRVLRKQSLSCHVYKNTFLMCRFESFLRSPKHCSTLGTLLAALIESISEYPAVQKIVVCRDCNILLLLRCLAIIFEFTTQTTHLPSKVLFQEEMAIGK